MNKIKLHTLYIVACCLIVLSSSVSAQDVRNDALRYTQISVGAGYSCAVLANGTARCWGSGQFGKLGNNATSDALTPVTVQGLSNAIAINAGGIHTCAVLANGNAQCWGFGFSGQLGNGAASSTSTPVAVTGLSNAIAISAGSVHTCAVLADGTARCWGKGENGRLGNNATPDSAIPVAVQGLSNATAISASTFHSCAVLSDGTARCWGSGTNGRLGNNATSGDFATPQTVQGLSNAIGISAGNTHACALLADGTARCWGSGLNGRLGNNATANSAIPVAVQGLSNAIGISAGATHSCAVIANGNAWCWGKGEHGRLGNNATANSAIPVAVQGLSNAIGISAGDTHACALLINGSTRCWGSGEIGRLGNGGTSNSAIPVAVRQGILFNEGSGSFTQISAGKAHTCATLVTGNAQCWGNPGSGRLGNGATTGNFTAPAGVKDLANATAISAGDSHSCALLANGTARCWGNKGNGRLGTVAAAVSPSDALTPVTPSSLSAAIDISAGSEHTCAVLANGTAKCWGAGANGRLGNNTLTGNFTTPQPVHSLSTAIDISAGSTHTCAVLANGTARCWGSRANGRIGNGGAATGNSPIPVTVSSLSNATAISAGKDHTCAVLANGTAQCWGAGFNGRLGDGHQTDRLTPVVVQDISSATAISVGTAHSCATLADGKAWCWGSGGNGRLGRGAGVSDQPIAAAVKDIKSATSISSGDAHNCALLAGGTAQCWGANGNGQLGDGKTADSSTPVNILEELRLWIKVFLEGPLQ